MSRLKLAITESLKAIFAVQYDIHMNNMNKLKLSIGFMLSMSAMALFADKISLKSGSNLIGTVGEVQDECVIVTTDDLGLLKIKIVDIMTIDTSADHIVQWKDETKSVVNLTIRDGSLVTTADGMKLDASAVKTIDPAIETWHGSFNVGFQASRGNTYKNQADVLANVSRRWERDRVNLDVCYYYAEDGKAGKANEKTEDRWDIVLKHDHFWFPKIFNYETARYERDMIQELNARYRAGLGGGYQWLDGTAFESTGKWSFEQTLGLNWIKEEYENNDDCKKYGFAGLQYAHHLSYIPKIYDNVEFFHNFEITPEVDEWEKYLAKADVGVSTKIYADFDLLVKIEYEYNSKPASDRKKDDTRYIIGLGYKW